MGQFYQDGSHYMPSNGTEGMSFEEDHCLQCINCDPNPSGKKQCQIWFNAVNSWPKGIKEWVYKNDEPTCTQFVKWDWGNDGDPDDPNNPKAPPPPTPINQLDMFPTYPNEANYGQERQSVIPTESPLFREGADAEAQAQLCNGYKGK